MLDIVEQLLDAARTELGSCDCQRRLAVQERVWPIQERSCFLAVPPQLFSKGNNPGEAFGPLAFVGCQSLAALEGCGRNDTVHEGTHRCSRLADAPGDRLQRTLGQALTNEPFEVAPGADGPAQHGPSTEDVSNMFGGTHQMMVSHEPLNDLR
jgi:hypothetical protein